MKIGYPCLNYSIGLQANKTFKLESYTEDRLRSAIDNNFTALQKILEWNKEKGIFFFRITSDLIPFASHPINTFDWGKAYKKRFEQIGDYIKSSKMRVSMHPSQYTLLNSPDEKVTDQSIIDLTYHNKVFDLMGLDTSAKIQIHVGGVYGEKAKALDRFCDRFKDLPYALKNRLVVENDDKSYSLKDCLYLHEQVKIPLLFDNFHHECLNSGESLREGLGLSMLSWKKKDGIPMIDYSSQQKGAKFGKHTQTLDVAHFKNFLTQIKGMDVDIMLEIKDKEKSALLAVPLIS